MGRQIEALAADLPPEKASIAATKVRLCVRHQRLPELQNVHEEVSKQASEARAERSRVQETAKAALSLLTGVSVVISHHIVDAVLDAVKRGDPAALRRAGKGEANGALWAASSAAGRTAVTASLVHS